jgi:hypothetical protein
MKNKLMNSIFIYAIIFSSLILLSNAVSMADIQNRFTSLAALSPLIDPSSNNNNRLSTESQVANDKTDQGQFNISQCDLVADGPLCLYNGDRILLPFAVPRGLVGYWDFDSEQPLDNSGNKNHAIIRNGDSKNSNSKQVIKAGPAFGGFGSSAAFQGEYLEIPFTKSFEAVDFSITFWFFLSEDNYSSKGTRNCPLIQRGVDDLFKKDFQRSPAIYLDRKTKNLKVFVKTGDEDSNQGENVTSNARLAKQRWHHVGIVKEGAKLKLYVNGILDAQVTFKSDASLNQGNLYIGNVPWLKEQCNFPFLIDEVRYYNVPIEEDRIQAEASPVLGGIEPSFLQLGCMNCSLKDASQSCSENYRLCSSIELHTGGYQIARAMGWLDSKTHMWTHGALKTPADFDKLKGLALCCVLN